MAELAGCFEVCDANGTYGLAALLRVVRADGEVVAAEWGEAGWKRGKFYNLAEWAGVLCVVCCVE